MTLKSRSIPVEFFDQTMEYREEEVDGVLQGNVYWKHREDAPDWWNRRFAGKKIGSKNNKGYYTTIISYNDLRCNMKVHTIVWILNKGCYPDNMLDHKDRNKSNNLIENLRLADAHLNNLNTPPHPNKSSQYKRVSFYKAKSKWHVKYRLNNIDHHIGYFVDELEAALAYNEAISKVFNTEYAYMNDISNGYTNKEYPNMPRHWVPEKIAA